MVKKYLDALAARLQNRYPGVKCEVSWNGFEPEGDFKGHAVWAVQFFAADRATLIRHGLASADQFEVQKLTCSQQDRHPSSHDGYGSRVFVSSYNSGEARTETIIEDCSNSEETFTKKVQAEVARCLKPFIRGTWKPPQPECS